MTKFVVIARDLFDTHAVFVSKSVYWRKYASHRCLRSLFVEQLE